MSKIFQIFILIFLFEFCWTIPEFHPEANFDTSNAVKQDKVNVNEMMAKTGSSSVLPCDPIFGPSGAKKEATWYKDGSPIAEVTGEKNAVYFNRSLKSLNQNVPEVGFLIITQLEKVDEGDYWCIRKDNGQLGEISRIKVAFLTEINRDRKLIANPETPFFEDFVEIECTFTDAYPAPAISWLFNVESLPVSSNFKVASNGSLLIHRFNLETIGRYDCVLQNFAGKTKTSVFLPAPNVPKMEAAAQILQKRYENSSFLSSESVALLKNSTFWFLIGCLSTCCLVLIYLFTGMICYRFHNSRPCTGRLPVWQSLLRADPALAPGFRKVVAPAPESRHQPLISSEIA